MNKTILFGLVLCVLIIGCSQGQDYGNLGCPKCICNECEEDTALVDVQVIGWYINELNEDELLFDYNLFNYGNKEARNIKVKCMILDEYAENILFEIIDTPGNIASNSWNFEEIVFDAPKNIDDDEIVIGDCYIISCSNCNILWKNIPELAEYYNLEE